MIRQEDMDPVFYCRRCLSLGVETEMGQDFCRECGSTDIGELPDIYDWEELYIKKYGEPYIRHQKNILKGE
jgi:hypothetical protein